MLKKSYGDIIRLTEEGVKMKNPIKKNISLALICLLSFIYFFVSRASDFEDQKDEKTHKPMLYFHESLQVKHKNSQTFYIFYMTEESNSSQKKDLQSRGFLVKCHPSPQQNLQGQKHNLCKTLLSYTDINQEGYNSFKKALNLLSEILENSYQRASKTDDLTFMDYVLDRLSLVDTPFKSDQLEIVIDQTYEIYFTQSIKIKEEFETLF